MNKKCYRLVWNRRLALFQVACEFARGTSKAAASPVTVLSRRVLSGMCAMLVGVAGMSWTVTAMAGQPVEVFFQLRGWDGKAGSNGSAGADGADATTAWGNVVSTQMSSAKAGHDGVDGGAGQDGTKGWHSSPIHPELLNNNEIIGGNGGNGGHGGDGGNGGNKGGAVSGGKGADGGNGGRGGNAMVILDAGVTLENNNNNSKTNGAKIIGGNGGPGGTGGLGGNGGGLGGSKGADGKGGLSAMGGYGIYVVAERSNIINAAQISPGKNGDGSVSQASIMYGKGASNSRLELQAGSRITSFVDARLSTGINTLALGGKEKDAKFDVAGIDKGYLGFHAYEKSGAGSWTLSGTTTAATPWTIRDGILAISEAKALGAKEQALTFAAPADVANSTNAMYTKPVAQLSVLHSLAMERPLVLDGDATVNIANGEILRSTGAIRGDGILRVTGPGGTLRLHAGEDRRSGGLTVDEKTMLAFDAGANYVTSGAYIQGDDSTLSIDLNGTVNPVVSAAQARLAGRLVVTNYLSAGAPASASQVASSERILIRTTNGITGDFSSTNLDASSDSYDYLRQRTKIVGNDYVIGMDLAWNSESASHGVFTIDKDDFTMDRSLANRVDGSGDLTKEGSGQLTLAAQNTYTGLTRINAGMIRAGGSDVIRASSGLQMADTGGFHTGDFPQSVAQISSAGTRGAALRMNNLREGALQDSPSEPGGVIKLGRATLTLTGDAGTSGRYTGRISGDGGLAIDGGLTQHLHGDRSLDYTGPTVINNGVLALHGMSRQSADKQIVVNGGWLDVTDNPDVEQWSGVRLGASSGKGDASVGSGGVLKARGTDTLEVVGGGSFNSYLQQAVQRMGDKAGIHKSGTGTLTFSEPSGHAGPTRIATGAVALTGNGSIAQSSKVELVAPDTMLDIRASQAPVHLNNLSGVPGSTLMLGAQDVILHQREDTVYAGDIVGDGGIAVHDGNSITLLGNTAYTGATVLNDGELVLDGSAGGAQLQSNVIAQRGASLKLRSAASLTGSIDPANLSLDASSVWNMTDDSQVDTLTLAGTINFVAPAMPMLRGRTLTASNWVGEGGVVRLYSASDSTGSVTDQIVIDGGSATGVTNLNVINVGGLGAKTGGDGIRLVATTNGASTDPKAFQLQNRLVAGAYQYSLKRGGTTSQEDWFLVSALRSETSLLGALGNQGLHYGETVLGSLQERTGPVVQLVQKKEPQVWGRLFGQRNSRGGGAGVIAGKSDARGFQAGSDVYVQSSGRRRDSVGMYLAIGQSDADIHHNNGVDTFNIAAGRNTMRGYSVGTYFTQLHHDGAYLDLALQGTRYVSSSRSSEGTGSSTTGIGTLVSAEIGQAFQFGNGHQIEPQAQLALQKIDMNDVDLDEASKVHFDSGVSISERLGLKWSKTLNQSIEQPAAAWLAMDILNNNGRSPKTVFSTPEGNFETTFADSLPGVRSRLSGGIHGAISKSVTMDVRLSAETSLDSKNITDLGGKIGVTWLF